MTDTGQRSLWLWQLAALFCATGWAVSVFLLLRRRSAGQLPQTTDEPETLSPKAAYRSLVAACAADQPSQARKTLIQWAAALCNDTRVTSLDAAGKALADPELKRQLQQLEQALYGSEIDTWDGAQMRAVVERLQKQEHKRKTSEPKSLSLYPSD